MTCVGHGHFLHRCWFIDTLMKSNQIQAFHSRKLHFKMSSAKCRPFCSGLNVLIPVLISSYLWMFVSYIPICIIDFWPRYALPKSEMILRLTITTIFITLRSGYKSLPGRYLYFLWITFGNNLPIHFVVQWSVFFYIWVYYFNSLAPGRRGCNIKLTIFKLILRIDILCISCEIALKWMPQDFADY